MKNILVTGGTGYIGSHTVLKLLLENHKVIVLDSNINSSQKVIKRIKEILEIFNSKYIEKISFVKGDVRDFKLIKNLFLEQQSNFTPIDAVIHFSGLKSVSESKKSPLSYWEVNILGTLNLLKIMEIFGCRDFIFSSSATVYGEINKSPFKENYKIEPVNPYAKTKATIENILVDIYQSNKDYWRISILRYFNPIGAHSSGLMGEFPLGIPNNLFPLILQSCIKNEKIYIYGNDWPTPDGTCIRDYIHIEDLAEAHIRSLDEEFLDKERFYCLNLGTGIGTSVLELINTFKKVNKVEVPFIFGERRQGDSAFVVADNSLAKSILNWIPKRNIIDMCRDGWNWQVKNPNGY